MISKWIDRNERLIFPLPALLFIALLMIFPLGYTIWNSFTNWTLTSRQPTTFVSLANYLTLFTNDKRFIASIGRTFYFTIGAIIFQMIIGVASGILLDMKDYRGKRVVNSILLLPMMATPVAIAMVWLLIYEPSTGVLNYLLRVLNLPTSTWLAGNASVLPSLIILDTWEGRRLSRSLHWQDCRSCLLNRWESARIDGATSWQLFWKITLPMLRPTLIAAALLRFIDCFKTFDIIYATTGGGPGFSSETLNIYAYQNAFYYFKFGYASSILIIFFAIVMAVVYLVNLLQKGAVD